MGPIASVGADVFIYYQDHDGDFMRPMDYRSGHSLTPSRLYC
jgi:hypothetical protein